MMSQEDILNAPIKGELFKVIFVRSQDIAPVVKEQHERPNCMTVHSGHDIKDVPSQDKPFITKSESGWQLDTQSQHQPTLCHP